MTFFGTPVLEWRGPSMMLTEQLYEPHQRISHHAHSRPYVCVVIDGAYQERSDGREHDCRRSTVLLHPPGVSHSDRFSAGVSRLLMLEIDSSWHGGAAVFEQPYIFAGGPAAMIGMRIHEEALQVDDVTPMAMEALVLELVAASRRDAARNASKPPRWLVAARERIDDSLPERCSVGELGEGAGVHPVHFARVFRSYYGCTVADYTRRQRIVRAKEAIRCGHTLAEAALMTGFADQSDLTRAFRRVDGRTPAEFRRAG